MLAEAKADTRLIAGGTDLMLHMDRGKTAPQHLIDIRRCGLNEIKSSKGEILIGATTTSTELSQSPDIRNYFASLWESAATLSVPTVRNMATIGGNLVNASPAADLVPPVLALNGRIVLRRGDSVREIDATELAKGPGRTVVGADELMTGVILPKWSKGSFHHFAKLGFRDAQIIAVVSIAFSCEFSGSQISKVGLAFGSVAPKVVRAPHVEQFLVGKRLTREVGEQAMKLLAKDISPISDIRSERQFRLKVAQNYLGDALGRAFVHSQGGHERGQSNENYKLFLKDPAPRPPSMGDARTDVLGILKTTKKKLRVVPTSSIAYASKMSDLDEARKKKTMAKAKKKATKKKATKKKATKKKATKKKATKKKATKKKATKKKAAKKKATKKKATKKKATKKKATKKKATKKKATKKKAAKKKPAKKKAAKKKPAKKKAAKKKR